MSTAKYDVLGIGNAIVDILAQSDDAFLADQGMVKGAMALVDEERAHAIYQAMGSGVEASGGSAANTIAGVASFGGTAAFIGRIRDDEFGRIFAHDLRSLGVDFVTPPANSGTATARCLILVTPDAQRTMNTHLGACVELTEDDVEPALVAASRITYLEGYLFDPPRAKDAFYKAAELARAAGRKVALTLSDSFCVQRYRDEFADFIGRHVDILFANEHEVEALLGISDMAAAADYLAGQVELAAITRSAQGSLLARGNERVHVPAAPLEKLIDSTGAGDLYAAGVLFGLSRELPLAECGRLGSLAAAEVLSHYGARPEVSLTTLR